MEKRVLQQAVSGIVLLFLSASVASGATFYVRTDGGNGNTGTSNTAGGAWQTINYAAGHIVAGDTVRVQAGTYVERAVPSVSGTSGNTVTLVADGAVTTCGMTFSSKTYIRVIGFTLDPSMGGCSAGHAVNGTGTNTGLEFWNVAVQNTGGNKAYSFDIGLGSTNRCDKCIWIGGSIVNVGNPSTEVALLVSGDDDFVGYINFQTICYVGIGPAGARGRFVNNNFRGLIACNTTHPDNFYIATNATEGWTKNLVESVFNIGTPTSSNNKFHHQQNQNAPVWSDNIYRLNASTQLGGGVMSLYNDSGAGGNLRTRTYNNTWVQPERAQSANGCQTLGSGATTTLYEYNELFYQCWSPGVRTNIAVWGFGSGITASNLTADYNLAYDPAGADTFVAPWTSQTHKQTNVNPLLNNVAGNDFTLQSGSGARAVGGPLTTATSCSGTTLNVATDGGAFFVPDDSSNLVAYGGKLVPGDTITLVNTPHTVLSISGDAITLDASVTCSNGDAVYFGGSSSIDVGAYPFKAGGYTLSASYSITGGTATITPIDASLVRFVVCYNDSVPYAVANRAPYTCASPAGTFSARVYPRYASQTQWVTAGSSSGLSAPTAPSNPRIIP
jgi:hypothetical protein